MYHGEPILALAAVYYIVDMHGIRRWTFPFIIFGMNSIFIYSVGMVGKGWIDRAGLEANVTRLGKSSYGAYLRRILTDAPQA